MICRNLRAGCECLRTNVVQLADLLKRESCTMHEHTVDLACRIASTRSGSITNTEIIIGTTRSSDCNARSISRRKHEATVDIQLFFHAVSSRWIVHTNNMMPKTIGNPRSSQVTANIEEMDLAIRPIDHALVRRCSSTH